MKDQYIWKIKCYQPYPVVGCIFCVLSLALLFLLVHGQLVHNQPIRTILPPVIVLTAIFFTGLYEVLKRLLFPYPIQINICSDGLEIVRSKGTIKRIALKEISRITFDIRSPQRGWFCLSPPKFKFYDRKDKLMVEGDVPNYEQFQEVYSHLKNLPIRIFIPDYTKASYEKFFAPGK